MINISEEIEYIIEEEKTVSEFGEFPLELEIDYRYAEENELNHPEYDSGYVVRIETMMQNERYGHEIVFPEDTDANVAQDSINTAVRRLKEHLWEEFVLGQ